MTSAQEKVQFTHSISIVIPVYLGATTLPNLVSEISKLTDTQVSDKGNCWKVREVVLVWDRGPDNSDSVIRSLESSFNFVRSVWLSKNYGQHAATLAGIASTSSDWVVSIDEDGQHNPADIGQLLDTALTDQSDLVYGHPINTPPHGRFRNFSSRFSKWLFMRLLSPDNRIEFQSFRLILGHTARAVAAYCGPDVYLDVALGWVANKKSHCGIYVRKSERNSGYTLKKLSSHFWKLILSSGTRPLRLITVGGILSASLGFVVSIILIVRRVFSGIEVQGWTSNAVLLLLIGGTVIGSLGIIAEYLGMAIKMSMGKPLYVVVPDPVNGPFHADNRSED